MNAELEVSEGQLVQPVPSAEESGTAEETEEPTPAEETEEPTPAEETDSAE